MEKLFEALNSTFFHASSHLRRFFFNTCLYYRVIIFFFVPRHNGIIFLQVFLRKDFTRLLRGFEG